MSTRSTYARKRRCASSATKAANDACPCAETLLAAAERPGARRANSADAAFRHLLHCRECRAALAFVCAAAAFELDRKRLCATWRRFCARFPGGDAPADGFRGGERIDAIAANAPAVLVLQSSDAGDRAHFWRANIAFPDVDRTEAGFAISVEDAGGTPIPKGTFILFGIEISIADGTGRLTRRQFAERYHKGGAAFRWPDGRVVPGAPVLNA